ncbi:MAG: response regulator [Caldithrix sp.]|nr:response regulator [Caldithrix sp.]
MQAKILIVDDNPNVLKLLKISLSKEGYQVIDAENGEVAYEMANKEKPDLIISDVMMPRMDGIELCWMIRENSQVPIVPFIFLTSFDDAETEIRGFRAGADDYINKPINRKDLLDRVERLLSRVKNLKHIENKSEENDGFKGDLKDLSIVELVQMLNLNKKTGVLKIDAQKQGEIYMKNGQLFAAQTADKSGEQAMYELVTMSDGTFNFKVTDNISADQNINNTTMNVVMEACRIMDENMQGDQET